MTTLSKLPPAHGHGGGARLVTPGPTKTGASRPTKTRLSPADVGISDQVTLVHGRVLKYRTLSRPMLIDRPDGKGKVPFVETILPNAWTHIVGNDVPVYVNHDESKRALASADAGTLKFKDTPHALYYCFQVPDSVEGRALVDLFGRGEVVGTSMAFSPINGGDHWAHITPTALGRVVSGLALRHIAIITSSKHRPLYPSSSAQLWRGTRADLEALRPRSLVTL